MNKEVTQEDLLKDYIKEILNHFKINFPKIKISFNNEESNIFFDEFSTVVFNYEFKDRDFINDYIYGDKFHDFETKINNHNMTFRFKELPPNFVKAKIGDFVSVYYESFDIDEFTVGIVSSVIKRKNKILYGCRHILPTINNICYNGFENLEITREDYGGYYTGFYKILSVKEAKEILKKQTESRYEKALVEFKNKKENTIKEIDEVIDIIKNNKVISNVKDLRIDMMDKYSGSIKNEFALIERD